MNTVASADRLDHAIVEVKTSLCRRFSANITSDAVERIVEEELRHFVPGAHIRAFIPIFVEKESRLRLDAMLSDPKAESHAAA